MHEFVPHTEKEQRELAAEMNVPYEKIATKVEYLSEVNPMLGHRGCRLGNTYPEITEMQTRAIIEAAMNVHATGIDVKVEIMVPLVGNHKELRYQKNVIDRTANEVFAERNDKIDYMVGTMIEVPRAAVTANQIAEVAEFFSFGTNDLSRRVSLRTTRSRSSTATVWDSLSARPSSRAAARAPTSSAVSAASMAASPRR